MYFRSRKLKYNLVFFSLIRNFAFKSRNYSVSAKKRNEFSLFCSRLFVTLKEFAGFLYIKAVWGFEDFLGYGLETVLNSTFCYKLLSMSTR